MQPFIDMMLPYTAWIVGGLVGFTIIGIGGAILIARGSARPAISDRLRDEDHLGAHAAARSEKGSGLAKAFESVGTAVSSEKPSSKMRQELAEAGYYGQNAPFVFMGIKLTTAILGFIAGFVYLMFNPGFEVTEQALIVVGGAAVGLLVPNFVLNIRRSARRVEVSNHLPDAVDLLEICVTAGMGLDMACAVTDQIRRVSPILADEMSLTDLEINLGESRASAMRHMASRTQADELNWLVSSFIQSEKFGTSIADTLRAFAVSMRESRSQKAEEAAEKIAVKLLFPMVIFIFPVILIVCAGPAGISISETL